MSLKVVKWDEAIQNAIADPEVGISLAAVAGGSLFTSYVTEIKPMCRVEAHFHPEGDEIYQILSGRGVMHIGVLASDQEILWDNPILVQSGDFFTIPPKCVHQLNNPYQESLILVATCSPKNIVNNRVRVASRP